MNKEKPIDKVTPERLNIVLRMAGIHIDIDLLDRIIDVVELIENKGGEASLNDVCDLQSKWRKI